MSTPVPLKPEEISAEHRDSFYYERQELGPTGNRRVLKIDRQCSRCPNTYTVDVPNIRGDIARGRRMRAGVCKNCKGRVMNGDGYILLLKKDHPNAYSGKYVPEHILVMEDSLGRYLDTSAESVHHIDGDKSNNDISNLQLRTRYHGKGQVRVCGDCGSSNILHLEIDS